MSTPLRTHREQRFWKRPNNWYLRLLQGAGLTEPERMFLGDCVGQPGVTYPSDKVTLSNLSNPICCGDLIPPRSWWAHPIILAIPNQAFCNCNPWGTRHCNKLLLGSRSGAEPGPAWTSLKRESAAQHLWVAPCGDGLRRRQRWLCSPVSHSEPGCFWPPHPAHPSHMHWQHCPYSHGSLPYSLHSVAIPKHDVVSEGAVNIHIYLLDFRWKALCLLFHLLERRGVGKRQESDTISARTSLHTVRRQDSYSRSGSLIAAQSYPEQGTLLSCSEQWTAAWWWAPDPLGPWPRQKGMTPHSHAKTAAAANPAFAHLSMQILSFQNLKPLQFNPTLIYFDFFGWLAVIKHWELCWSLRNQYADVHGTLSFSEAQS